MRSQLYKDYLRNGYSGETCPNDASRNNSKHFSDDEPSKKS